MQDDDQYAPLVESPLTQHLTRNGLSVQVYIYGDGAGKWILEVQDPQRNSHVWEDRFDTDQLALDEAIRALDEEREDFLPDPADRGAAH
jgi:hypothetical protein